MFYQNYGPIFTFYQIIFAQVKCYVNTMRFTQLGARRVMTVCSETIKLVFLHCKTSFNIPSMLQLAFEYVDVTGSFNGFNSNKRTKFYNYFSGNYQTSFLALQNIL